jgi:hypothetical protein
VVSFGNNGIDVWIDSVGILSADPIIFKVTIKARTGAEFGIPKGSIINIEIENGLNNKETIANASLVYDKENSSEGSPNFISAFTALISTTLTYKDVETTISGTISITDPNGNQNAINNKSITCKPFPAGPNGEIDLTIHEKLGGIDNWKNDTTSPESEGITNDITEDGITVDDSGKVYIFTKGGPGSFEANSGIYVEGKTGEGVGQIVKLNIQRNDNPDVVTIPIPFGEKTQFTMKIDGFTNNEKNTVTVKPVGVLGVEGPSKTLDFVLDTEINTPYLEGGIIGELDNNGNIQIDLSKLIELSGVTGYSYVFTVGNKPKSDNESNLDGQSSTILTENSITGTLKWEDGKVEIPTSGFIGGSKGTLLFTVYDRLGHKKTFEKTYFIPKQSSNRGEQR